MRFAASKGIRGKVPYRGDKSCINARRPGINDPVLADAVDVLSVRRRTSAAENKSGYIPWVNPRTSNPWILNIKLMSRMSRNVSLEMT